jgi:hypothetical protein
MVRPAWGMVPKVALNLSLSSKESLWGHFACSTSSRDSKIQNTIQYEKRMENLDGKWDLMFLWRFLIRILSLCSKELLEGEFACSTSSRDSKIQKIYQYEEMMENHDGKGDLQYLARFIIRSLSLSFNESLKGHFACCKVQEIQRSKRWINIRKVWKTSMGKKT